MNRFLLKHAFANETDFLAFCYTDPEINDNEHAHEFDELVIVDKGYGVHVLNGEFFFIQEGDVFLVKENDKHFYNELGKLKLMNIQISTRYEYHYLKNCHHILDQLYLTNETKFIWLMPKDKIKCLELTAKIAKIYTQSAIANSSFLIESLFMQILSIIITSQQAISQNTTQFKIRKLLIYLQQNYFSPIDWHWLAEQFFMTQKTMSRQIKEITGMSPVNYLNRLRVLHARNKLRQTDDSITEIAGHCGFSNSDYFAKCYRRNFGISPSYERR